jgi:hypothetical protein
MQKRTLTVSFERAVSAGTPNTVEVTVTPLTTTTNSTANTVIGGGPQTRIVLLANDTTTVTFSLVPSEHTDLDEVITYRIAWRERYVGSQYTADFTMPDADTNYADLAGQGRILMIR